MDWLRDVHLVRVSFPNLTICQYYFLTKEKKIIVNKNSLSSYMAKLYTLHNFIIKDSWSCEVIKHEQHYVH